MSSEILFQLVVCLVAVFFAVYSVATRNFFRTVIALFFEFSCFSIILYHLGFEFLSMLLLILVSVFALILVSFSSVILGNLEVTKRNKKTFTDLLSFLFGLGLTALLIFSSVDFPVRLSEGRHDFVFRSVQDVGSMFLDRYSFLVLIISGVFISAVVGNSLFLRSFKGMKKDEN